MWKLLDAVIVPIPMTKTKTYPLVMMLVSVNRCISPRRNIAQVHQRNLFKKLLIVVRKSLRNKKPTKAVLDVTDTSEIQPIQPIIASKWQSSISPASESFSPKSKCTKLKVLSKNVEIVTEKHVCIVGKIIQWERKLLEQLQCGNLILMMLLVLWAFWTCDNMQNMICQSQKKIYLAKQTLWMAWSH